MQQNCKVVWANARFARIGDTVLKLCAAKIMLVNFVGGGGLDYFGVPRYIIRGYYVNWLGTPISKSWHLNKYTFLTPRHFTPQQPCYLRAYLYDTTHRTFDCCGCFCWSHNAYAHSNSIQYVATCVPFTRGF